MNDRAPHQGQAHGPAPGAPAAGADIDLLSPDVLSDPHRHYASLRRSGPVHYLARHRFWLVLGYDDVVGGLKQPGVFSSVGPSESFDPALIDADPPGHTRVRRILARYFSPHSAQELEGYARRCAETLLAGADRGGGFDLVNDFAIPLAEMVAARLLGLPPAEAEAVRRELRAGGYRIQQLNPFLNGWAREYVGGLGRSPGEDLCSRLLRGEGEESLSPEEVASLLKLMWVAGTVTPGLFIASSVLLLLRHPRVRAELQGDPSLLPAFVEEALRLEPPELMVSRVTRREVSLSGAAIPAGADVKFCLAAANRDPEIFAEPDRLSLRRSPNNHLSFAAGPHYCLGAGMARLEARVALEVLLGEWPGFAAARPLSAIRYGASLRSRALESLFVRPA